MFRMLLQDEDDYFIPKHFPEASSKKVLATELIQGVPLDIVAEMDQETRNKVNILTDITSFSCFFVLNFIHKVGLSRNEKNRYWRSLH